MSTGNRGLLFRIALILTALLLSACGASTTPAPPAATQPPAAPAATATPAGPSGTLVVGLAAESEAMDPYFVYQNAGQSIMRSLFDNLLDRDFTGNIIPSLAESWSLVDEKTLEFKLRKGVKFHNGEDFDANSVKFSIERMLNPDLKAGGRNQYASIDTVNIVDPFTVRIVLKKTDATVIQALSGLQMLPPNYLKQVGDVGFGKAPVGTGPFKFVEWVKDDHATVEANPNYWVGSFKGKPLVKTVIFRPIPEASTRIAELKTGRVHLIQDLPTDQVKDVEAAGFKAAALDTGSHFDIWLVADAGGPLADKRVRQALNYGVNVEGIVAALLQGRGQRIASPFAAGVMGYDSTLKPYPYDLNKAKSLLAEAGLASGFDIMLDACTCDRLDLTQAVVGELAKMGVKATIRSFEISIFNDNWIKHTTSGLIAARLGGSGDPSTLLNFWVKTKGLLTRYSNTDADKLIDQGAGTLDVNKRIETYKQLGKVLNDDPPAIYLWSSIYLYGVSPKLDGWKPHTSNQIIVANVTVK
ncbi:MAG: hypothetical protein HYR71_11230 [Chloroflexi bacterium]|nr:hypothetical protein [Chloroflexota bacterium]